MENRITFKDIVNYSINMLNGKLKPFLKNELNDSDITSLFNKMRDGLDTNNYYEELYNFLHKYYNFNRDVYLTNSGRDALYCLLYNLNLKKREIIIPSYSCLGLIQPILQLNLKPHFIDIDRSLNPSLKSFQKAINDDTAAVVIPHLGGTFAEDTLKIINVCKKNNILVIEDCCQSFGLKVNNKKIGTFADISFFSSGIGKPIFTPSGGWVLTKKGFFKKFKHPRNMIQLSICDEYKNYKKFAKKYSDKPFQMFINRVTDKINSLLDSLKLKSSIKEKNKFIRKLNNFNAYLILDQLKDIDKKIVKRKEIGLKWTEKLQNNDNVRIISASNTIYNKFYVCSEKNEKKHFLLKGFEVENGYTPLHLRYDFYKFKSEDLDLTNKLWENIYSLPVRPSLDLNTI